MTMKIRATASYEHKRDETVSQFADRHLDGGGQGIGQMEALAGSVDKLAGSYSNLLELLAKKGLLTAPEVFEVVKGYANEDATFTH